jgi:hypothetical protein
LNSPNILFQGITHKNSLIVSKSIFIVTPLLQ